MKLIPASSARWMIRTASSWSGLPQAPNIIAPRHSGLTRTPVRPSVRVFTPATLSVQQREAQRLLGRQVYLPALLAARAATAHRGIVALEAGRDLDPVGAQADRAGQRCLHQHVRIVGAKAGCVGEDHSPPTMNAPGNRDNRRYDETPHLG